MPSNATSPAATILLATAVAVIGYVVVLTWLWPTDLEVEAKRRIASEAPPSRSSVATPGTSTLPAAGPAVSAPATVAATVAPKVAVPATVAPGQVVAMPTPSPSPPIAAQPAPAPVSVATPPRPPPPVDAFADDPYAPRPAMPAAVEPAPPAAPRSETGRPAAPVIAAELRSAATESLLAQVRADPFEFARQYHVDLDAAQAIADGRAPMPEEIIRSRAGL